MTTLTLKNIPETLYNQLKEAAKLHHRSINSEILYCLEQAFNPHKISLAEQLAIAKQMRAKSTRHLLTDTEINAAKQEGRH